MSCLHVSNRLNQINFICEPPPQLPSLTNFLTGAGAISLLALGYIYYYRNSSLRDSCSHPSPKWAKFALFFGAKLNPQNASPGDIPLHTAAFYRKPDMVQFLHSRGADINLQDKDGNSALHWASLVSVERVAQAHKMYWPLNNASELQQVRVFWRIEIDAFIYSGQPKTIPTIASLIEKGAHVGIENKTGQSPLQMACLKEFLGIPIAKKLIEHKADLYLKDKRNKTIQHYIEEHPCDFELTEAERKKLPEKIPEELKEDPSFPKLICPITRCPIRNPVLDGSNGRTLYEREAILREIKKKKYNAKIATTFDPEIFSDILRNFSTGRTPSEEEKEKFTKKYYEKVQSTVTSPLTGKVLTEDELLEVPHIQDYIEKRLHEHMQART